ncbi:hypothetical protein Gotri_010291 [Gossypium trilobum]|uniref:Uncharacterized protein n=1 Tax=Gossypium trilobum TaxID=34281 RepID=A0A7J9EPZ3_9ROSI|nr:hypothetical protein [Gossypium trilobum]
MVKEKITCIHDQMVELIDLVESRNKAISSEGVSNASQNEPSFDLLAGALIGQQVSTMMLGFLALFVAIILMVIFLFFSVEFPLTPHPISLKARVPWHNRLFYQFIRFIRYFSLTIQSIPTIVIYTTQNNVHENPAQAPPPHPQVLALEV